MCRGAAETTRGHEAGTTCLTPNRVSAGLKFRLSGLCQQVQPERKKPCRIELLFPSQPPLLVFRALLTMPRRVAAKAVVPPVGQAAGPLPKLEKFMARAVYPPLSLLLAAVQQEGRDTMHLRLMPILRVDAIPIHPAKKCPPVEGREGFRPCCFTREPARRSTT